MAIAPANFRQLSEADRQRLLQWLTQFDRTWASGRLAAWIKQLPPSTHPLRLPALVELIKIDLCRHWQEGRPVAIEAYVNHYPELANREETLKELQQAEFQVRRQSIGLSPRTEIQQQPTQQPR